ncbi:CvfB family protein [Flavobacterium aciduliphilum]|uniref:S1 motif domain-containing protein n=1 Tax=Flavobacterium aciduliphilum TaxID=1101402 RepID=A0A328Y7V2_9FLAO|nr:S1-like domain-containing RNA-binding protein [Flavobacterium aciduliphilum]RAR70118.1 hypothetical protein CLV55_11230 [Flavobacterium aciduliphilum]
MNLGQFNSLEIVRKTKVGLFLSDGKDDVLLPNKYVPKVYEIGEELPVFVYLDHEERPVATTLKPYIQLHEFAHLRVNYINKFGAFLDWGLEKDLFVPFREQANPMEKDKRYLVYMYLDAQTGRLVASSKINSFFETQNIALEAHQEVDAMISHVSDIGINVIIENKYKGLVYKNEIYDDSLRPGKKCKVYIKNIRPDGKIDVTFHKIGVDNIELSAQQILGELRANKGFLRLNDNSHPEDIKTVLKMSKKTFKKAIGHLYKEKIITIKEEGIYLL